MKMILASVLMLAGLAHAEDSEILKNLSAHPVIFDVAIDIGDSKVPHLISKQEAVWATLSCTRDTKLQPYLDVDVYNRFGLKIGDGFYYTDSSAACDNLVVDLFDHPENFQFSFGPLTYWGYREIALTATKK